MLTVRALALSAMAPVLLTGVASAAGAPPGAAVIARSGNGRGAATCAACHGADGSGQAAAEFPRLAGLNAAYLLRQLDDFADGARRSAVMQPIAQALAPGERKALAEYFSRLPVPGSTAAATVAPGSGLGERLATRGRWSRQVPGCVDCHGPHGIGVGENFPPLAGQPVGYIASQLRAFKDGSRSDDSLGLMRHVASALDAADIKAVSAWFAAQSPTAGSARP